MCLQYLDHLTQDQASIITKRRARSGNARPNTAAQVEKDWPEARGVANQLARFFWPIRKDLWFVPVNPPVQISGPPESLTFDTCPAFPSSCVHTSPHVFALHRTTIACNSSPVFCLRTKRHFTPNFALSRRTIPGNTSHRHPTTQLDKSPLRNSRPNHQNAVARAPFGQVCKEA